MFSHLRKMNRKKQGLVAEAFCLSLVSKDLKKCVLLKFECTSHSTKPTYYNWLVVWKHLLFSLGKTIPILRAYFSNGLVPPPTRKILKLVTCPFRTMVPFRWPPEVHVLVAPWMMQRGCFAKLWIYNCHLKHLSRNLESKFSSQLYQLISHDGSMGLNSIFTYIWLSFYGKCR